MFHRIFTGLIVALVASSVLASAAAQPEAVEVSLVSVTPGTPSGDGDWCVGAEEVTITAHAVDLASQSELTEGQIWFQFCAHPGPTTGVFPKEDCDDATGPTRWDSEQFDPLSALNPTASITFTPNAPVWGLRLHYRPEPGSGFKRTTSESFNLDTTCLP